MKSAFRSQRWLVALAIAALTALAWANRFVQDDAFISFRYADHLVEGRGLVWNDGERVEGYTNFLWVLAIAGLRALGVEAVAASYALGLGCFALSLFLTYRLGRVLVGTDAAGLLAMALAGTNYSFSAYATGGLETQLQACLLTASALLALGGIQRGAWPPRQLAGLSVLMAAAVLTRPDSALPVGVLGLACLAAIVRRGGLRQLAPLALPFAAIVGAWLAWKWHYYGDLLPNTFHAKLGTPVSWEEGGYYLQAFLVSYFLAPFPLLGLCSLRKLRESSPLTVAALLVALWVAYVFAVGGCFMEFRFFLPILPLAFVLVAWLILAVASERAMQGALVLLVLAGSLHHAWGFGRSVRTKHISTTRELHNAVFAPHYNWAGIGKALSAALGPSRDVKIAVTAAGAIPYYSRLETLDMLGLNDAWVARHGIVEAGNRIGHRRLAPIAHVLERGVNLIVGHPTMKPRSASSPPHYALRDFKEKWWFRLGGPDELLAGASVLEIPVDDSWAVVALYVKQHPAIEAAAARHSWVRRPLAP
ncbi:MAG: hypothetical protein FJ291_27185 [Planctomycetes bacterium]|nr:hypothetical protein [Planctomycetota bacterium]